MCLERYVIVEAERKGGRGRTCFLDPGAVHDGREKTMRGPNRQSKATTMMVTNNHIPCPVGKYGECMCNTAPTLPSRGESRIRSHPEQYMSTFFKRTEARGPRHNRISESE